MQQHWFSLSPRVVFTAVLLLCCASVTEAQVTEARKQMENARKLYTMSVDALAAGKFDDAVTRLADLKANVNMIVERQLWQPVERTLHEKDRSVLLPKVKELDDKAREIRTITGLMSGSKDEASISSNLSRLKDGWQAFDDAFQRLSNSFDVYWKEMKELQDRVTKFQEFCGRDCS